MSIEEILMLAGRNTLLGMGTVFLLLFLMSMVIGLFKYIYLFEQMRSTAGNSGQNEEQTGAAVCKSEGDDESETIAAVMAAVECFMDMQGYAKKEYIVRGIKRRR